MTCSPYNTSRLRPDKSPLLSPVPPVAPPSGPAARPHFRIIVCSQDRNGPENRIATALRRQFESLGCSASAQIHSDPEMISLPRGGDPLVIVASVSAAGRLSNSLPRRAGATRAGVLFAAIVTGETPAVSSAHRGLTQALTALGLKSAEEHNGPAPFEGYELFTGMDESVFHGAAFMQEISNTAALLLLAAAECASHPLPEAKANPTTTLTP